MLSFSNTTTSGASQPVAVGSYYNAASAGYGFSIFCPTARSMVTAGTSNTVTDSADRTSQTCFMRGYKENLRIQTSSPLPWIWRRIVFTSKGPTFNRLLSLEYSPAQNFNPYSDTSVGMARLWFNMQVNTSPLTVANMFSIIFKGAVNQDWNDVTTAPVDQSRITVLSDKTQTIKTGNSNGYFQEKKLYYPFNKNIVYDDDEAGATTTTSYYSTDAKAGMGDVYIVDFTVPGIGGTSSDIISINANSTLYWHEK